MAVFRFTSGVSLLVGFVTVAVNVSVLCVVILLGWEGLLVLGYRNWSSLAELGSFVVLALLSLWAMVAVQFYLNRTLFHPLTAFLYAKVTLRTNIGWEDAKYIYFLLVPNESGHWYPMNHIREVPSSQRRSALLKQAETIYRGLQTRR
jgi:hypothetical protein